MQHLTIVIRANEALLERILDGRAESALTYDDARTVAATYAAVDALTGEKVSSSSRAYKVDYRQCWNRLRAAQTLDVRRRWDDEEMRRTHEFVATAPARKLTYAQQLEAQYGKAPLQRHRRRNAGYSRPRHACC
jgi:hypothetical protein